MLVCSFPPSSRCPLRFSTRDIHPHLRFEAICPLNLAVWPSLSVLQSYRCSTLFYPVPCCSTLFRLCFCAWCLVCGGCVSFEERAVGILQAMLELHLPKHGRRVSDDELERFWDGEAPRIGDAHPSQAGLSQWSESLKLAPTSSSAQVPHREPPQARAAEAEAEAGTAAAAAAATRGGVRAAETRVFLPMRYDGDDVCALAS